MGSNNSLFCCATIVPKAVRCPAMHAILQPAVNKHEGYHLNAKSIKTPKLPFPYIRGAYRWTQMPAKPPIFLNQLPLFESPRCSAGLPSKVFAPIAS